MKGRKEGRGGKNFNPWVGGAFSPNRTKKKEYLSNAGYQAACIVLEHLHSLQTRIYPPMYRELFFLFFFFLFSPSPPLHLRLHECISQSQYNSSKYGRPISRDIPSESESEKSEK